MSDRSSAPRSTRGIPDSDIPEPAAQILREGPLPIRAAAREAGVATLSYHAALRAWRAGTLAGVRIGGRVHTSAAAIRRWLAAAQPTRDRLPAPPRRRGRRARPKTSPAEAAYLRSRGLPAGSER